MKRLLLLFSISCMVLSVQAQPVVTIQDIQTVSQANLGMCMEMSPYENDTVTTHGVVVMEGGIGQNSRTLGRNVWIQNGHGPFSGLEIFTDIQDMRLPIPNTPTDIENLVAGDSVEVTGIITSYQGETEILPLFVTLISSGKPVFLDTVSVGDLNDSQRNNILTTGEQWEGAFIEVQDVTVTSVDPFSGNSRVSFYVADAAGNEVNISDRFLVQQLPGNGGTFVAPSVGTKFDYIRGVVAHSGNDCLPFPGRGYEMFPFDETHYAVAQGSAFPTITGVTRNPVAPTSSMDANISASIEDTDGSVTSAELKYAVGIANVNYLSVPMTNPGGGTTYSAAIPNTAYSDGDFVKYYVCATDNDNQTICSPNVPSTNFDPLFFTVRDNGLTIRDIQFTPFSNGNSGYINSEVTVTGIVNASATDLGYVYIQQRGLNAWAGLNVFGNTALAALELGDSVSVTGTVSESFGFTVMNMVTAVTDHGNTPEIEPLEVDPSIFSSYDFMINEQYEGMLLKLADPSGGKIYIIEEDADLSGGRNFAEYRVGLDVFDPINGSRVLAGRVTNSAFSSLNFSYVNDMMWEATDGMMNIDPYVVTYEDSMTSITGIMYYGFGNMKLLPRYNSDMDGYMGANGPGVGIIDELAGSSITAYPNPVSHELNIDYTFTQQVQSEVVLVDMMGRNIAKQSLNGLKGTATISTVSITPGTYMLLTTVEGAVLDSRTIVVTK